MARRALPEEKKKRQMSITVSKEVFDAASRTDNASEFFEVAALEYLQSRGLLPKVEVNKQKVAGK